MSLDSHPVTRPRNIRYMLELILHSHKCKQQSRFILALAPRASSTNFVSLYILRACLGGGSQHGAAHIAKSLHEDSTATDKYYNRCAVYPRRHDIKSESRPLQWGTAWLRKDQGYTKLASGLNHTKLRQASSANTLSQNGYAGISKQAMLEFSYHSQVNPRDILRSFQMNPYKPLIPTSD